MQISSPDYSNLINATANNASVKNGIAAQKTREVSAMGDAVLNLLKTSADIAIDVIKTQNEAQQANLKPELEAKSQYYNQLLNESIKNGTTYIDTDEAGKMTVHYAPEVLEYKNTWLDDVNSRSELSSSTIEWANRAMDSVYNQSDEQVLYTIAANNASLASSDMDEMVRQAAITAANSGDYSYLENVISGLNISDQYKQAYTQWAKPIYESEYQTNHANELATTQGIDAAYKYINSLPIESSRKDTLKSGAYTEFQRSNSALLQSTDQSVATMLEAGSSWSEIHKTLEDVDGYSAYQRELVKEEITKIQSGKVTELCAPYLAQVQSGTMTVAELEGIKKDLKLNKGLFSGGLEGTYETYMGIVDNAIEDRKQKDISEGTKSDSQSLTQFKLQAENYYDMWNQGKISGDEALSQIRAIAEANPDDLNVVNSMNDFVNKIISEKVPLQYRDYFNMKMDGFNTLYKNEYAKLGYQPMNDDYVSNYETLYKDTVNFIAGSEDLKLEDIDSFMAQEMDGFFARYADAKANEETIPTTTEVPTTVYSTKDLKNSAQYYFNAYNGGRLSSVQALQYLSDLANASSGDPEALAEIEKYTAQINEQKVPDAWKTTFNDYTKDKGIFDTMYLRQVGEKKLDDLDDDQFVKYINDKSFFEGALSDYISENPGLTRSSINAEAQRILKTFSTSYATEDIALKWEAGADSRSQSFIDLLNEYYGTTPFRYNYNAVSGNIEYEWVDDKAQSNWDNAGRYGLQSLKAAGYDVSTFNVLEVGGEALPIMVFNSSDGKSMYTINLDAPVSESDPQVGDVVRVEVVESGNLRMVRTSGTVSPTQSQVKTEETATPPEGSPRGYVFDESSMNGVATPESSNFLEQQKKLREESEAKAKAEKQAKYEANAKKVAERNTPPDERLTYYADALRSRGMDADDARRYAPDVIAEVERLEAEGVPRSESFEKAIKNLDLFPRNVW